MAALNGCPGHPIWVVTGPLEDDVDPDIDYCDGTCRNPADDNA